MSEDHHLFQSAVEPILADTLTAADLEAAERRQPPARLFGALRAAGVLAMLAPEDRGGVGATLAQAMNVLRAAGAAGAPGPILETILGQSLLARSGVDTTDGLLALAFVDDADGPEGERWAAPPPLHAVPWGGVAEHLLIVAHAGGGARLVLTPTSAWSARPGADAAGEPRDAMQAHDIPVLAMADARESHAEVLRAAALLRGGQMLGAIEWVLARSVAYAKEREQFGRPIGAFQAVQHMLAELADHTLAAAAITEAAAEAGGATLLAAARSRLADAADAAITIGHQVHGALGFSREYPLNYRTRRLMAWRDDYGGVGRWRTELARSFAGLGRDGFWPALADTGLSRGAAE